MKKRTVGIYADYNASEQTLCAEFLTRYIVASYRYAKWFVPAAPTPDSRYYGFSHQWDTETIHWHQPTPAMRESVRVCDTFFFFQPNNELLALLPDHAVTAFVLDPRSRDPEVPAFAKKCQWNLVTSRDWIPQYPHLSFMENLLVWPFDPPVACIPRRNMDYEKQPRVFLTAFGMSLSERMFVEQTAELVKLCLPNVQVVVGFYDAKAELKPGVDSRTHDWRLLRYLQNSDWLIDLNTRPFYTLFPACAGGFGLQWIGFEIAPNTSEDCGTRRHLIQAPVEQTAWPGGQRVVPDLESTVEQIYRSLTTTFHGEQDRNANAGAWDNRRAEFLRVTNLILGIKSRF